MAAGKTAAWWMPMCTTVKCCLTATRGRWAVPTQEFQSVKSTLQALEEIESGNVVVHPDPEAKREALRRRIEAERIRKEEEERKIKEQIAKEKEDGEKI